MSVMPPTSFSCNTGGSSSTSVTVLCSGTVSLTCQSNYEFRASLSNVTTGVSYTTPYHDVYTTTETITMAFNAGDTVGISAVSYGNKGVHASLVWEIN